MRSSRLLPFVLSSCAVAAAAQTPVSVPTFGAGDVARLACRVVSVTEKHDLRQLQVEVENPGPLAAEPLEFELEVADRKAPGGKRSERFRRVQLPRARRFGRPVPPGGKQVYPVATWLPVARGAKGVRVRSACWYEGGAVPAPQLQPGEPRMVQRESMAGVFNVTEVEVGNPFDRDVDVLLRVTLTQPFDSVELMGLRLAAGQRRAWILPSRAGSQPFLDEAVAACHLRATAFEVVDWSLVAPDDPQRTEALLRPAYEAWYRWSDAVQSVSGRFAYRGRVQKGTVVGEYEDFEVTGRFTLPRGGDPVVEFESQERSGVAGAIAQAFAFVARPDWATLAARNELALVADDRVELRGPGWGVVRSGATGQLATGGAAAAVLHPDVQVAHGRVVGTGYDDSRTTWTTSDTDRGYLVTRTNSTSIAETIAYGECEGELVPTRWASTTTFTEAAPYRVEHLELTATTFGAGARVTVPAPAGDGAAALRAIWDAGHRLPEAPLAIAAAFTVTQPGVDLLWHGHKRISGKLTMVGIGRHMAQLQMTFDKVGSPQVENDLAFLFRDRLLMWYLRDFSGRLPFDTCFAGATVAGKSVDGSFRVEGAPIAVVRTQDGLVRGWTATDGTVVRLGWKNVGGQDVAVRFERDQQGVGGSDWTEVVTTSWAAVGDRLLPTSIALERIFGRDFGTETISLKNVTVKEDR